MILYHLVYHLTCINMSIIISGIYIYAHTCIQTVRPSPSTLIYGWTRPLKISPLRPLCAPSRARGGVSWDAQRGWTSGDAQLHRLVGTVGMGFHLKSWSFGTWISMDQQISDPGSTKKLKHLSFDSGLGVVLGETPTKSSMTRSAHPSQSLPSPNHYDVGSLITVDAAWMEQQLNQKLVQLDVLDTLKIFKTIFWGICVATWCFSLVSN